MNNIHTTDNQLIKIEILIKEQLDGRISVYMVQHEKCWFEINGGYLIIIEGGNDLKHTPYNLNNIKSFKTYTK
jgi:hypothetical protein